MVLLFLRELIEQLSVADQVQQSYVCPMTRCRGAFAAPLQVIQHLLSCPELPSGEFDCDKCSASHSFPTNEKDWAQWTGWRCPQSNMQAAHNIQRKRSLGSKMKDFALWKKEPSRKQNTAFDPHFKHISATDTRPGTATSNASSTLFAARAFQHHVGYPGQAGHGGGGPGFVDFQKPALPTGLPEVDGSMFWPGFDGGSSDLPSTVSSIAPSSTLGDSPSERLSQNTSQSTLFNPGMGPYQVPTTSAQDSNNLSTSQQQYAYPSQLPFNDGMNSLPGRAPSTSAMCLDEPMQSPISPTELRTAPGGPNTWWAQKVEVGTPRPTPGPPSTGPDHSFPLQTGMMGNMARDVSSGISTPTSPITTASPYYQPQPTSNHSMSRALSQESMHSNITTVFGTPAPEGSGRGPIPHAVCSQHAGAIPGKPHPEASVEDLVCDECQWKPRGVRENLKGYLRKHKNTHKGVRLACDVPGCVKTFSRLDNLKKHKKDKHGIEDVGGTVPGKRVAGEYGDSTEEESEQKRQAILDADMRVAAAAEDYSMLWPALHF
jgi:hypothetical protein